MSKVLEAFSRITLHTDFDNDGSYDVEKFEDDCKGVEEALQELDDIKNSKQSEAIEGLKRVWYDINIHNNFRRDFKDLTIIENYILKTQDREKVLSIIKEKNVDIKFFKRCKTLEEYNDYCNEFDGEKPLVQDEFDVLKEW